jgi:hypothetical protein
VTWRDTVTGSCAAIGGELAGADGHPMNTVQLPPNTSADETFRELAVQNEGGVVYAHRTEAGMTLERYDCR